MRICIECKEEAHDIRLKICMNCMSDLQRNTAYGYWKEEETNWSEADNEAVKSLLTSSAKPTSLRKIDELIETLPLK